MQGLAVALVVVVVVGLGVALYKGLRYTGLSAGASAVLLFIPQLALIVLVVRVLMGKGQYKYKPTPEAVPEIAPSSYS